MGPQIIDTLLIYTKKKTTKMQDFVSSHLFAKKKHIRKISHFNEIFLLTCYLLKNLNLKKKKIIIT